jgi:hypothetical protein
LKLGAAFGLIQYFVRHSQHIHTNSLAREPHHNSTRAMATTTVRRRWKWLEKDNLLTVDPSFADRRDRWRIELSPFPTMRCGVTIRWSEDDELLVGMEDVESLHDPVWLRSNVPNLHPRARRARPTREKSSHEVPWTKLCEQEMGEKEDSKVEDREEDKYQDDASSEIEHSAAEEIDKDARLFSHFLKKMRLKYYGVSFYDRVCILFAISHTHTILKTVCV